MRDESNDDEFASFSQKINKDKIQQQSEAVILDIVKQTNGVLCGLDEAASKLIYFDKKKKRRVPWNCDLTISSKLAIKISAYIYVSGRKLKQMYRNKFELMKSIGHCRFVMKMS